MDEFALIKHWTANRQAEDWQRDRGVVIGIGDDAAVVEMPVPGALRLVYTMDTMVETVHFNDRTMKDEDIGYKALAANVSDIFAMGATPLHALVSISIPKTYPQERVQRIYDGIYLCASQYGVAIVGGDTTSAPTHLTVAITLAGQVPTGRELRRSGACVGDRVFLAGLAGESAAGLHLLGHEHYDQLMQERPERSRLTAAHQRPIPSATASRLIATHGGCTSLNDVSDGVASEAWEIAEASQVQLVLEEGLIPIGGELASYASRVGKQALDFVLYGGEDYALLGTVKADAAASLKESFTLEGLPFYLIGEVEAVEENQPSPKGVCFIRTSVGVSGRRVYQRAALPKKGYNHFTT